MSITMPVRSQPAWEQVDTLVEAVIEAGAAAGLPFVAAQSDLGDPVPMACQDGTPYASRMPWVPAERPYWQNRRLVLQLSLLHAARIFAEPIWFADGRLGSWRPTRLLDAIDCSRIEEEFGLTGALVAPVHLAGGRIGAVVWVTTAPIDMPAVFAAHAEPMFSLARRLLATHAEVAAARAQVELGQLSAREAQCVRWAAAGKTNDEIGTILSLSVSTVRFHLRSAGMKLGATTRARIIRVASGHGYVGSRA